ncbi:hypothetical protein ACQ4WX_03930 [Streptomyces lasalocidi]
MLGIARVGAACLPLDAQAPAGRILAVLADGEIRTVVTDEADAQRATRKYSTGRRTAVSSSQ